MLIKLTDHFRGKKPGEIIDWPEPMADILIRQKRAVPAEPEPEEKAAEAKAVVDGPPVDKSMTKRVLVKKK